MLASLTKQLTRLTPGRQATADRQTAAAQAVACRLGVKLTGTKWGSYFVSGFARISQSVSTPPNICWQ
jgi:hypothetical protein